jgi:anti-sigma regulatory factor (Ser/Thr protein kinase)
VEALLIARWLRDLDAISVLDEASVSLVRERVRETGAAAGLPHEATASLVTAASELAHNQLVHGRDGRVAVRLVHRRADVGVEVVAADRGEGIADPERALRGGGVSPSGLGIGLAGVLSLSDEVDIDVRLGEGTCVWARKFPTRGKRRLVGVYGRPIEGERISGDDAGFARSDGQLMIAVADGLGHGPDARTASALAIDTTLSAPSAHLDELIESVHDKLRKTRGSVLGIARVDASGTFESSIAGNIVGQVLGRHGASRRLAGVSRALGMPGPARRAQVDREVLGTIEVLALYSDGLSSHGVLGHDDVLLRAHPIVLAQHLLSRFASTRDDALVAVVA